MRKSFIAVARQPSTAEAFATVAGTEIKYLIQKGKVESCFELRGGPEELCSSSRWTSVCNISSTHIKWRRDTELNCFYNSTHVILKGEPAIDQNSISFERENISGISFDQRNIAVSPPKPVTKSRW
ncbi:hypothetical protein AGOR_G00120110 [Albula goreensis]|uniref:Uncharacterized protein n=1 Tax=Albula goreensis TaxID=1534307 RepID=A0A8T3DDG3_9TELE|nr:hypothetical protein AGOR_G00120110 [Albula goreensis]